MIRLGFTVGTGEPVVVPLKHLVITGQTQEAGKTTALDALITRSTLRALTFITKRGEASFTGGRRVGLYFREQADWQSVAAILEASRQEKLKFERAWIIRASKGARSLADVQANVREALKTAKGLSADVYYVLDAYLDVVVPQIAAVRWTTTIQLGGRRPTNIELGNELKALTELGFFTRENKWYSLVPDMKVNVVEARG